MSLLIILPNQLFPIEWIKKISIKNNIKYIALIEEPRYFTDFKFHKTKLIYHVASMLNYKDQLITEKFIVYYYKCIKYKNIYNEVYEKINDDIKTPFYYFNPTDHKLFNKFKNLLNNGNMLENLNFLITTKELSSFNNNNNKNDNNNIKTINGKYSFEKFYIYQRKKLNILLTQKKQPIKGKWSFDQFNRKKIPKDIVSKIPNSLQKLTTDSELYYKKAIKYIDKHFGRTNYGDYFCKYPISTKAAIKHLKKFIKERLYNFGLYQDAINNDKPFLFHSVISPMMNIGILPDKLVLSILMQKIKNKKVPLNSLEGFIRQIIGWRNYVYTIYMLEPKLYEMNYFNHTGKIGNKYWGIKPINIKPIDESIAKIVKYSYVHHIERLMILGNWFLLNRKDPKEVHRIFMEWTIDAYDWVMTPNIMGMSQFADGGTIMMKRIYISSSNYIKEMSTTENNDNNWNEIWDLLYYKFINDNKKILLKNYITARMVNNWNKKPASYKKLVVSLKLH